MTTSNPSYLWDVMPQSTVGLSHRSTTSSRHPGRSFEGTVAYEITRIVLCEKCGLSRREGTELHAWWWSKDASGRHIKVDCTGTEVTP